jgi:hypothetical protein
MELINPNILWGLLAISAPILIHLWNQKKTITLDWAAMKWLSENQKLKAKGLRIDDLLLLLLRVLALVLLVFILSKPLINKLLTKNKTLEKIHVFQKNKTLYENFKFEFSVAIQKNEKVYWLNDLENTIKKEDEAITNIKAPIVDIQSKLNILHKNNLNKEIHFYTYQPEGFSTYPNIYLTENIKVHTVKTEPEDRSKALYTGQYIYTNNENILVRSNEKPTKEAFEKPVIKVFIDENPTLKAAFEAIKQVYGFPFEYVKTKQDAEIIYHKEHHTITFKTVSDLAPEENILNLNPDTSKLVFSGKLPEIVLEKLLHKFQISDLSTAISDQQLAAIFQRKTAKDQTNKMAIDRYLLFLFLGIVMAERYLSLKQNK